MSSDVEVMCGEPSPPNAEVQPNADVASESEHSLVSPSNEQLLDRLAEVEAATQLSVGPYKEAPPPAKKAKILGERWHTPPLKKQSGRSQWEFGHKQYALMQLKKANGNKYYVRTKVLLHWELSSSFLNEWAAKETEIRGECLKRADSSALHHCGMGGAGKKALFQQLEAAVVAWLDEQFQKNLKPHPNVLWGQVQTIATDMGIDTQKHLKANWRRRFKQRHNIYFRQAKLVCLLTDDALFHAMKSYLTHHRASGHFWGVEKVFSLVECPLSLDGEIRRYVVLRGDKGEEITNVQASDAKRFCTYLPIAGVTLAGDTVLFRPMVMFKGERRVSAIEKRLYNDHVFVRFQKKGVTDEMVMVQAFQSWFPANASPRHCAGCCEAALERVG